MTISPGAAEIINRKKLQYCRFADTNQWHLLDDILLPEAIFTFVDSSGAIVNEAGTDYSFSSKEEFISFFRNAFQALQTIHVVGPGELEQTGLDEIKAVFGVIYHVGAKGTDDGASGTGGGHYYETWKRMGDDWFMENMRMQRIYWKTGSNSN